MEKRWKMESIKSKIEKEFSKNPIPIPEDLPFTAFDINCVFNKVARRWGMSGLRSPFITHDLNCPVHFGISLNWKLLINTAYLPKNIDPSQILWWIEYGVIAHELGHYHWCPYDGSSAMKYLLIIQNEWKDCTRDQAFFVLNYFSDIIVDWNCCTRFPNDAPKALQIWFEWNDIVCKSVNIGHTDLWRILTRIFEILWYGSSKNSIESDKEKICRKIFSKLYLHASYEEILRIILQELKKYFIQATQQNTSKNIDSIMTEISQNSIKSVEDFSKDIKPDQTGECHCISVDINGKIYPFDILISSGDPFENKIPSRVCDTTLNKDIQDMLNTAIKMGCSGMSGGTSTMVKLGLLSSNFEAKRMFFETKARNLINYSVTDEKYEGDIKDFLTSYCWSDPLHEWDVLKSKSVNPIFPFPPFSRKWLIRKGTIGTLVDSYRDALIVIDSSGSMGYMSDMQISTPIDFAILSGFAILYAVTEKNANFAVINFSDDYIATEWLSPLKKNVIEAQRVMMRTFSQGTTIPIEKMKELVGQSDNCVIIIISDADIYNWSELQDFGEKNISKHPIVLFQINTCQSINEIENFQKIGGKLIIVKNVSDLPDIVIGESKKFW